MISTSFNDTLSHFAKRSKSAAAKLERWKNDPFYKPDVVPFVEAYETKTLYQISPADIATVCQSTEHALGEVKRADAEAVLIIRDWHPAFAFIQVLHYSMESLHRMPTYQEFRKMSQEDPFLMRHLYQPAQAIVQAAMNEGWSFKQASGALRWRIGNAYYAVLKETYAFVMLREMGVDVRYHPLADALFATDCWSGDTAISMYVRNSFYKSSDGGRKATAADILKDASPKFEFKDLALDSASVFGSVHLPSRKRIDELAGYLLSKKDQNNG